MRVDHALRRRRSSPPPAATSRARCSPARSAGTPSPASCSTAPRPSSSADPPRRSRVPCARPVPCCPPVVQRAARWSRRSGHASRSRHRGGLPAFLSQGYRSPGSAGSSTLPRSGTRSCGTTAKLPRAGDPHRRVDAEEVCTSTFFQRIHARGYTSSRCPAPRAGAASRAGARPSSTWRPDPRCSSSTCTSSPTSSATRSPLRRPAPARLSSHEPARWGSSTWPRSSSSGGDWTARVPSRFTDDMKYLSHSSAAAEGHFRDRSASPSACTCSSTRSGVARLPQENNRSLGLPGGSAGPGRPAPARPGVGDR